MECAYFWNPEFAEEDTGKREPAKVAQKFDSVIYRKNHYPLDRCYRNKLSHPVDMFIR